METGTRAEFLTWVDRKVTNYQFKWTIQDVSWIPSSEINLTPSFKPNGKYWIAEIIVNSHYCTVTFIGDSPDEYTKIAFDMKLSDVNGKVVSNFNYISANKLANYPRKHVFESDKLKNLLKDLPDGKIVIVCNMTFTRNKINTELKK